MIQCDIVKVGKGTSTCSQTADGTVYDKLRAYQNWNVSGTVVISSQPFETIVAETYNNSRPIEVGFWWNTGGGHSVLADGYSTENGQWVSYMDPKREAHFMSTYTWFKGGSGSGSDHTWGDTLYQLVAR